MNAPRFLRISPEDDVAVAIDTADAGVKIRAGDREIVLREHIPMGHKVALRTIAEGETVLKYGYPIGSASAAIPEGSLVHTGNLRSGLSGPLEYTYHPRAPETRIAAAGTPAVFSGYRRPGGSVGIRNELWIIPTVGCVNGIVRRITAAARTRLSGMLSALDGVRGFEHPCGCSQTGGDHEATRMILAGLVRHPNAGGVLVLGLGCENNTTASFRTLLEPFDGRRVKFLSAQEASDELEDALSLLEELAGYAAGFSREPVPASELVVGLKCGGSDGFSGITANPLLGRFSDRLTGEGGTAVLTEVPEMFGAETILMDRAADREVFADTVKLINDYKSYFISHRVPVYENPSPGNRDGGITTLEEKSLGCVQKGGSAPVTAVYPYGGRIEAKGLVLLSGPGNDMVSVTALAAAGAQLVLFTTGRGTPFGGPVPTLKVSSTSELAKRKPSWTDFDAGRILDASGADDIREIDGEFFRYVLDAASGTAVWNEKNDCREIAILKDGVTL